MGPSKATRWRLDVRKGDGRVVFAGAAVGFALSLACGPSTGGWHADDARKATTVTLRAKDLLALCPRPADPDAGPGVCRGDYVRALATDIECKEASLLYAHREPIPEDAGGDCRRGAP